MPARIHKGFFTKVKVARELLRSKAEDIINEYMDVAAKAKDAGDYLTAAKALQWLIEHMPSEEDGTRIVDGSVDKQITPVQGDSRPTIQIGIQVGGSAPNQLPIAKPRELPKVEVIDVK